MSLIKWGDYIYLGVYISVHGHVCVYSCIMHTIFAQLFEEKIRMCIIHGYNDYMPWV